MKAVFNIKNVSKVYGADTKALSHIDLEIYENEFLCFLGPSGCGKSTLLEIIAGLQKQTDGEVLFEGISHDKPSKHIGFVFQDASLFPWRTIIDNIAIGLELNGMSKKERYEIANYYLDLVGLNGFGKKYPHQLSGGMRQRAGIARALANNPKVLLMDEPFGAVDHLTRIQLQNDLLEIFIKQKTTIVFVTHDVSEAVFLADRIVLFSPRPGRIKNIYKVPVPRPRNRDDKLLIDLQNRIYNELLGIETQKMPEYSI